VDVSLDAAAGDRLRLLNRTIEELKDLRWRYVEGPGGQGRAPMGISNSTGCSSVWGSTYPYNPYPFPWVNHLFQDAPSVAIGIFDGHMRKMADGFAAVRRAELQLRREYSPGEHEPVLARFNWEQFTDEEFAMCPPLFAVGGDGAMLDIGFQNLSRLLASGKPIRVMVLDTQVYSNTGGQACTSGYLGQISDMAAFGPSQHGKRETRKELALIAMAHREAFVLQSSQATPSHLMAGVLKGLQVRRPAVFILHSPCPPEHGIGDDAAARAAKYALEGRAFPFLVYDPDAGSALPDCLSLDGNPSPEDDWPEYDVVYVDENGEEHTKSLPFTTADWAATEGRFRKHFRKVQTDANDDELVPFHEYLTKSREEREGLIPFVYTIDDKRRLRRLQVSSEIVALAAERLLFWSQLRQMAGIEVTPAVQDAVEGRLEEAFAKKAAVLRVEYEAKITELKARYPPMIARRLAEGLIRAGNGQRTIADLLAEVQAMPGLTPLAPTLGGTVPIVLPGPGAAPAALGLATQAPRAPAEAPLEEEEEEDLSMGPYIETARCTTCDECTNLNRKMFAYDKNKQAVIKDPTAGPFKDLVMAAEKCPVAIIHPGTPLNPKERQLEKWIKRAEPFS
ncbi:MAG: ferredoxin, partial [Acidimicrobiia bacterium]